MSTKTVSSNVILEGHANWDLWIFVVKRIAEAGDVWEYVNPDGPHQSAQKPEKPVRPAAVVNPDGSPATQPADQDLKQYNQDCTVYYKEIKEYRRIKDKLGHIQAHIAKTIQQNMIYLIKDQPELHDQLRTLRDLYSPT
ncbi:hypothetical protein EJ04DRAFT_448632, partial [Polyplosphaeria fusca]